VIAGLPGTGIGGLFYLVCALLMPARELWRWARGHRDVASLRLAVTQCSLALSIIGAMWATSVIVSLLVGQVQIVPNSGPFRIFYVAPAIVAFGTLCGVLLAVEVLSLTLRAGAHLRHLFNAAPGDRSRPH
jgi:hypothetical protein